MIVRKAKDKDMGRIKQLAEKNNLSLPDEGLVVVVEADDKIEAFANIRAVLMIEPFVSENPIASKKLWEHIKTKTQLGGFKILRCFAQEKDKNLFGKLGFYRIFEKHIPMEINFYKSKKGQENV